MKKTFKFLTCLFVAILCFGQMWATDTMFKCKLNGSVVQERGDNGTGDFFSITFSEGSYSWKSGSSVAGCTYDGVDYTSALKFDSKPTLSFTTTQSATIIVVMSTSKNSDKAPKLDGSAMTSSSSITGAIIWTAENVAAGSHNVKYNSEIWIHCVYAIYPDAGSGSGEEPGDEPGDDPESDTCPESGVLFSWLPKTGLSNADISAGTYDLPGDWLTSVSGGSAQLYVPENGNMRIRGSQLAYNSSNPYIHIVLDCALAAGDVIDINSSGNTNNIWLSLGSTRPSKAADAAAEIVQGTSFVLSTTNGSTLIGEKEFYVWRNSSTTQVGQFTITRPYTVSFVSAYGTAPTTPTKAVSLTLEEITGVAGWVHTGWTADKAVKVGGTDKAAGAALDKDATVTISANTVFTATWEEHLCDGPTITTQPASAYYITGRAATALSCTATAGGEGDLTYTWYSCDNTSRTNPVALAGAPTPSTDEDGTFYYYCVVTEEGCGVTATSNVATITVGAKEKLLLIKVATTGGTNKTVTGYFAKDATVNLQSDCKFGSGGYMGMMVQNTTFREDDELNVHITTASSSGTGRIALYSGTNDESTLIYKYDVTGIVGDNKLFMPEDVNGRETLYICRTNENGWNAVVNYIEVHRAYPKPVLTAITISGATESNVNQSTKTISLELPAGTNLGSLSVTPTFLSNDPAQTSGAVTSNKGAWVIGANTYVVTDKDGDTETYTINLSEAAAIKEVVISGTLTVVEGSTTTLTASVIDTDDKEASIQTVTWSVKSGDEALAEVSSAGMVTGKAAGTAHIIATSVADDSKSAEVAVTVTENPCRTWNAPTATFSDETLTIGKLQIVRGACSVSDVQPYTGASKVYGIKIDNDSRFVTLSMSDHSQFESLTLGAASGSNGSSPKYVVVASSAEAFAEGDVLSATEYVANAKDASQALNEIELPTGTRYVRVYRKYNGKGDGTSVFLYHVAACKKDFVALTSVAVADKTLAVDVAGVPAITLTPANADVTSYAWEIVSDATGVATIDATTGAVSGTAAGLVTVKVTVTDALSNAIVSNIATITIVNKYETVVPVSATQTWDWAPVSVEENGPTISDPDTVLANYLSGDEWKMLAGAHADRPYRSSTYKAYQGKKLSFKAVVPGILVIYAGRTSSDEKVYVNGYEVGTVTSTKAYLNKIVVPAGDVVITSESMRIYSMTFDTDLSAYTLEDNVLGGYDRTVNAGNYGTICLPNSGVMSGASIFEIAYYDEAQTKIFFDEIINGQMVAGRPYIFLPNEGIEDIVVYSTDNANALAGNYRGLYGFFDTSDDNAYQKLAENDYFLYNNQYYVVDHAAVGLVAVGNYRAYIKLSDVDGYPSEPAPGRRRVAMSVNGKQVATELENVTNANAPRKVLINGRMFIMIGEKMYDVTGQIAK
ncbi:MAG: Ig-like domain-containing protein [Paludibacteraceae bacterium]|nr:Ig-like domain-containing protein [Paludibacteraceae bacterium]